MHSSPSLNPSPPDAARVVPSLTEVFLTFLRLGATAFGGPAMIAQIRDLTVRRKRWLDDPTFADGIVLAQSIPGATAMQVGAWVGLVSRGPAGAVLAFVGFGLPAFFLMLGLSATYVAAQGIPAAVALLDGLQIVVVALVAHAAWTFGQPLVKSPGALVIVALSGVAYVLALNPFAVIVGSAVAGLVAFRGMPPSAPAASGGVVLGPPPHERWRGWTALGVVAAALFGVLRLVGGRLFTLTALMVWINLFAFGGGFSSLPLMLHEVVTVRHWMDERTFMDGIALGQVTPGPISITATFIGYQIAGLIGAVVGTVAMFGPSLVFVIGAAPYFGRIRTSALYARASRGITASFVALLLFVTYRFAAGITWRPASGLLAAAALVALLRRVDVLWVVLAGAVVWLLVR
jgi:chromate transporter